MSLYDQPAAAPRLWLRLSAAGGLVVLVFGLLAWAQQPDGCLHVFFFDTPGDAILVQSPAGRSMLIDGGADPTRLALYLGETLPFWKRSLEVVVLTGDDEQRMPGQVAALARYRVNELWVAVPLTPNDTTHVWVRLLDEQQTAVGMMQAGQQIVLDGATLSMLVADAGQAGPVLRLEHGATSLLLDTAGVSAEDPALQAQAQPVTVLAYPWERTLDEHVLAAWQPRAVIFTSAYQSDTPVQQTFYERAQGSASLASQMYHPALHGTLELMSNGVAACIRPAGTGPCIPCGRNRS